jgi:hypothetical protein
MAAVREGIPDFTTPTSTIDIDLDIHPGKTQLGTCQVLRRRHLVFKAVIWLRTRYVAAAGLGAAVQFDCGCRVSLELSDDS